MAVKTIPTGAELQPDSSFVNQASGIAHVESYKGDYADLESFAQNLSLNVDTIEGEIVISARVRRAPGDLGILELTLAPELKTSGEKPVQKAIKSVWSCKSVRNDHSLFAYCGTANTNPNRAWIECWLAERDGDIAAAHNYKKDDGTIADINNEEHASATVTLMAKFEKGIESVVRFYPVLSVTSTYADIPETFMTRLGYVDVPSSRPAQETKAPANLSTVISAYNWLKVQDDVQETPDGKWQRVESWMGSENVWDSDLYGSVNDATRWPMPYNHGEGMNA